MKPNLLILGGLVVVPFTANAQSVWNTNGGSWNTGTNWTPNGVPDSTTAIASFVRDFTATPTITLDNAAGFTVNKLQFDDTGGSSDVSMTINAGTGGTLTFGGTAPTADIRATTVTINPAVTLGTGFNKIGGGTLVLNGTVTGWTSTILNSVTAGTLTLGSGSGQSFTWAGVSKTTGAGTVQYNSVSAGEFTLPSSYSVGAGGITLNAAGTYDGTAGFTKTGSGTLTLGTATTNVNGTFDTTGTLNLNGPVAVGAAATFQGGGTIGIGGAVSGTNGLTKTGAGTLILKNTTNSITGAVSLTTGTLQFDNSGVGSATFLGAAATTTVASGTTLSLIQTYNGGYAGARTLTMGTSVTFNGGTMNLGSTNGALFSRIGSGTSLAIAGGTTIALSNGGFSQDVTIESAVTGTGALNLNRANTNTKYLNLKGNMSGYSGNVTIGVSTAAGYVLFGHSSGWGTGSLTLTGSGSRVMIGDEVATAYNSGWTGSSTLGFTTGTFAPTNSITLGASSELSLMNSTAGYGILFSPANGLAVNGGTLSIKGSAGTSAYAPAANSTWIFGGSALSTVSGNTAINNSGVVFQVADAVSGTAEDTTISGVVSGNNGFKKTGPGTLSLTGANSLWSGAMVIDSGTVQLGADAAAGSGLITIGDADVSANTHSLRLAGATIGNDVVSKFMYTADYLGSITAQGGVASTINGDVTIMPAVSGAPSRGGHLASTGAGSVLRLMGQLNVGGAQNVITQRDGTVEYGGGGNTAFSLQVTGTSRIAANDGISTLSNVQLGVSGAATLDLNGFNQSLVAVSKGANAATITNGGATDSTLTLTSSTAREYAGVIQDGAKKVSLIKEGNSSLTLSGTNTYTGDTTVSAGTLLVSGSLGNSAVTVGSSGALGGDGTIGGTLYFEPGADFVFDPLTTLTVNGASVSFGGFSIANLVGFSAAVLDGTYTLINGSATFDFTNVANFGEANAYDLGGGRKAYFTSGSLNLVVVPEPAAALIGGMGMLLLLRRRRA